MDLKLKLTWKFFAFLGVLVLSAVPAVMTNSLLGYGAALLVLTSVLLSLLWLCLLKGKVRFALDTETQSCVRGEEALFQVRAENASRLPVAGLNAVFFLSDPDGLDEQTTSLRLTLAPRETRAFSFTAAFPHIGNYRAGVRRVEMTDLFGIFRAVRAEEQSYTVEVLPRVAHLTALPITTDVRTESARSTLPSPLSGTDYTGVREYAFGDPIKSIHWKLSAHAGGLMTKQLESYSNAGVSVVLDFVIPASDGAARLDEFDAVVECGVSAGDWAARQGMDYDLIFYRRDKTALRTVPASFRTLHGVVEEMRMTDAETDAERSLARLLRENCQGVYSQTNIVVCASVLTRETAEMLVRLKQGGRTPILLLVLAEGLTARERERRTAQLRRLQSANIACQVLSAARELEG